MQTEVAHYTLVPILNAEDGDGSSAVVRGCGFHVKLSFYVHIKFGSFFPLSVRKKS